jgi:hypothetical protein
LVERLCTTRLAVPLDVSVTLEMACEPIGTVAKATVAGLRVSAGTPADVAMTPTPDSETATVGVLAASLAIVNMPWADPVDLGINCTGIVKLCPPLSVAGRAGGTAWKEPPERVMDLMLTGALPTAVNVKLCCSCVPTVSLPNCKDVVLTLSAEFDVGGFGELT